MADDATPRKPDGTDDELSVWEAIQTFETILEVFPEDVNALESLALAYEEAGDTARAREKSLALARLLSHQHDWRRVQALASHLLTQNPQDEEARALLKETEQASSPSPAQAQAESTARVGTRTESGSHLSFDLRGEVEMAWHLLQNEMITQQQYETAIEGLTESRMTPNAGTSLSLLQELRAMERVDMEKITDFLCADTNTPFVDLSRLEIQADVAQLIPLDQCRRLGILPFERLGSEVMVAVLNPVDKEMRRLVAEFLGARVHFYMASPDGVHNVLSAIESALQKQRLRAAEG